MPGGIKVLGKKLETLKEGDAKRSDVKKGEAKRKEVKSKTGLKKEEAKVEEIPSGLTSKIIKCTCDNPYQDKRYGPKNRVHNQMKSPHTFRCSVCGKENHG